jgi:hypothetical protein
MKSFKKYLEAVDASIFAQHQQRVGMGQKSQSNDAARVLKIRTILNNLDGAAIVTTRRGQTYMTPEGMGKVQGGSFTQATSQMPTLITQEGPEVDLRAVSKIVSQKTGKTLFDYDFGDLF